MTTHASKNTWLVTGASRGLGRALTEELARQGHTVVATARRSTDLDDVVAAYPGRVLALDMDVTDPGAVERAVTQAEATVGDLDVVVNNAGYGYLAAVEEGRPDDVRRLFDTNVHGVAQVLRAVLPSMRRRGTGHVVNVSSFGGLAAFPATGWYHATKFALEGLSESLAAELSPLGIRVTIVEPGGLRTDWAGSSMQQSPVLIADYEPTAGARRRSTLAVSGHQPGDPVRAARAVIHATELDEPPVRLLLGSDALTGARARWARLLHESDALETLSRSVDRDAS